MQFVYPAVLTPEEAGGYSVDIPDLEGCYTQGDDWLDAYRNAQEAIQVTVESCFDEDLPIPAPTHPQKVAHNPEELVALVSVDVMPSKSMKCVKKNCTIPEWLDKRAQGLGVNFSKVLQDGLLAIVMGH